MSNSGTPNGAPGAGTMTDTLEFVKNMWGSMKIPGMVMPSMSVDDINKQIADLKAVESWLTLNMNMLRGTIQALEVQSATIATLQAMSANMSSMMQTGKAVEEEKPDPAANFAAPFSSASSGTGDKPATETAAPQFQSAGNPDGTAPPFSNPAIWWNMLQDQFKQAVNTAMTPEPEPPAAKPASAAKRKSPKS